MAEEIIIRDTNIQSPFNIDSKKVGGAKKNTLEFVLTDQERKDKLINFIEVPQDQIKEIRPGTYARYELKTGEYRPGGVVLENPLVTTNEYTKESISSIKFYSGVKKNRVEWTLRYEDIGHIYVKPTLPTILSNKRIKESVGKLNSNIKTLVERIERLEKKIDKMERIMRS